MISVNFFIINNFKLFIMSEIDQIIDQIWEIFDKDNSGFLENEEIKAFINQLCAPGSGLEKY